MPIIAVVLILIIGSFSAGAQAGLIVTVAQGTFDVRAETGTFDELESTLKLQPWWGDINFAENIVDVVRDGFGTDAFGGGGLAATGGPFPVFNIKRIGGCLWFLNTATCSEEALTVSNLERNFIVVRIPEPATAALLSLGLAGVAFSRRKTS